MSGFKKSLSRIAIRGSCTVCGALLGTSAVYAAESPLAEIIVTAQKRSENLQDVPASVSAVGEEDLARLHVTQLNDYAAYMPGINVTGGGSPGQTMITLRGIAPVGPGSVVGMYIDDTPLGGSSNYARATEFGLDLMPYDIERVEILRGPQGTLYGAGSMGGLLKYVLRDPSTEKLELRAGVEAFDVAHAGDTGWGARAGINVPLGDTFAMRASYFSQNTPGYIDNVFTGEEDENDVEQTGGRASFLWQPSETFSVSFGGVWQRVDSDDNATIPLAITGMDPITAERNLGDLETSHPLPQRFQKDIDYYSATIDWDLGWGELVSASSYSSMRTVQQQDATDIFGTLYPLLTGGAIPAGLSDFVLTLDLDKWTQELRLSSSNNDKIQWRVGAFYTEEDSDNLQLVGAYDFDHQPIEAFAPYLALVELPTDYKEFAAFGDVTFVFSESFDLSTGLRWATNDQEFRQISSGAIVPTADMPGDSDESVLTYSVSPRWHVSPDTMLYLRVASGYRPGGPNVVLPGVPPSVDADELTNYEAGIKTELFEGNALMNVALFYVDWKDIQQVQPFGGTTGLANAGDAETQGVEIETLFSLTRGLQLGANVTYTEAELTSNPPELDNKLGTQLPGVPKWTGSLRADYSFQVFGGREAHIGAGWRYVDERQSAVPTGTADVSYVFPSYDVVDLTAEITFGTVTARAFMKNLTDERAYVGGGTIVDGLNTPVRVDANVLQPRTLGLSMDVRF